MKKGKNDAASVNPFYWEMVCRRLKKIMPEGADLTKQLELTEFTGEQAVVAYGGPLPLEEFENRYGNDIREAVSWAADREVRVSFSGEKKKNEKKNRRKKRAGGRIAKVLLGIILLGILGIAAFLGRGILVNSSYRKQFYPVMSKKTASRIRLIQISGLHGTEFGENNGKLLKDVELLLPDAVLLNGNVFSADQPIEETIELCRRLAESSPVFCVYGKEEQALESGTDLTAQLESVGVQVLNGAYGSLSKSGIPLDFFGISGNTSLETEQWEKAYQEFLEENPENLKVVVSPAVGKETELSEADLLLCGETEPKRRNGKETWGRLPENQIFSRGLGWEWSFADKPELVIVDVSRY